MRHDGIGELTAIIFVVVLLSACYLLDQKSIEEKEYKLNGCVGRDECSCKEDCAKLNLSMYGYNAGSIFTKRTCLCVSNSTIQKDIWGVDGD